LAVLPNISNSSFVYFAFDGWETLETDIVFGKHSAVLVCSEIMLVLKKESLVMGNPEVLLS